MLFSRLFISNSALCDEPGFVCSSVPSLLCAAFAQDATDRVIAEAQKPSPLETNLQRLTDQVGGRVPGTPAMQKAVDWGVEAFKAAGADSVHTENFSIQALGGRRHSKMTRGRARAVQLRAVSIAWAPALAPHIVTSGWWMSAQGSEEDFAKAGNIAGAHPSGAFRRDAKHGTTSLPNI